MDCIPLNKICTILQNKEHLTFLAYSTFIQVTQMKSSMLHQVQTYQVLIQWLPFNFSSIQYIHTGHPDEILHVTPRTNIQSIGTVTSKLPLYLRAKLIYSTCCCKLAQAHSLKCKFEWKVLWIVHFDNAIYWR